MPKNYINQQCYNLQFPKKRKVHLYTQTYKIPNQYLKKPNTTETKKVVVGALQDEIRDWSLEYLTSVLLK